ncbi:MAG: hypothetical protein LBI31_07085 [Zoogloeaceae bacterium]|nr:hypothetical protein [Zoogloeaceae bacterium]
MAAVFLLVANVPESQAASFDCAKATAAVEKLICSDAELSKLDEEIQPLYRRAQERTADPAGFKMEEKRWLKRRDACKDAGCVSQAYRARLTALRSLLAAPKPCFRLLERKWPEVASGHYPVCVDVLKSMNALCGDIPLCEWKVSPSVPSLSLPQWEELDPKEHLKLIQHLEQRGITDLGPEEQWTPIPPDILRNIEEGKARLWRVWMDIDGDGEEEPVIRFHSHPYGKIDFYGTRTVMNVADASMTRLNLRFSGISGMDAVFHNNRPFVMARLAGGDGFSTNEPFWTQWGPGKTSVCVFEYLRP